MFRQRVSQSQVGQFDGLPQPSSTSMGKPGLGARTWDDRRLTRPRSVPCLAIAVLAVAGFGVFGGVDAIADSRDYPAVARTLADGAVEIPHRTPVYNEYQQGDPSICQSPTAFTNSCAEGEDAPGQTFEVWNCGEGMLSYSISCDAAGGGWQSYGQRYAIIVMGGNVPPGSQHYTWYWGDTYGMYTELEGYGFTAENIYFLSYGPSADAHPEAVDAVSTTANIQAAYQWAQQICTEEDLLYIYWVDHGSTTTFQTNNGSITHAELGTLMQPIVAMRIIGAYNPCYSGAVIDDISAPGVITTTSQDAFHGNSWGWAGKWRQALRGGTEEDPTDTDGDGYISMTEAYLWICPKSQAAGEHPMYDDNGDGVGHECDQAGFDPNDPTKDGYDGKFYSLDGWREAPREHLARDVNWLTCSPTAGTSTGEHDTIDVIYNTAGLACGSYAATITITAPEADNSPRIIPVDLTVSCTAFRIGGAVYTDLETPATSGLEGVLVTVEGEGDTFTATTSGVEGLWSIDNVPGGTYTVAPAMAGCGFQHVVDGVPGDPPPITITVDADHEAENQNLEFLADCGPSLIFHPTDDTYIKMKSPDGNYGSSETLVTENRYGHPSHPKYWQKDALVRFDVSSIPSGTDIVSATLYLYYYRWHDNNPAGRELTCYRVTSDWDEDTVTWNTQPTCAPEPSSAAFVPSSFEWIAWEVTSDVQASVAGQELEYGWKIMDEDPWGAYDIPWTYFHSKEYEDFIPYLEVVTGQDQCIVWAENFDDGDISDWTVENPYQSGDNPITIEPSTEQSVSPEYSFKVSGPYADFYGGRATGPDVAIDLSQPFTIQFMFRYQSFHWYYPVIYGPVKLVMDKSRIKLRYYNGSVWGYLGTESFGSYCPSNTWTQFRIEVDPPAGSYDVFVGEVYRGTVTYGSYDTGLRGFLFHEGGGDAPCEPNYVANAYFDNLAITQGPCEDCNENGVPDEVDIAFGTSEDTNSNGIPDECEVPGEDCNGNGIPDEEDIAVGGTHEYETETISPFRGNSPVDVSLPDPPPATGDVAVAAWASADLNGSNEYVNVFLNGNPVGQLFYGHGHQCTTGAKDRELLLIPQTTFNAALPDGITITLAPTSAVDVCSGSVVVRVAYPAGATDCNINGVPDECDIADGTSLDCNSNTVPDECEFEGCRFPTLLSENTTGYDDLHFIGPPDDLWTGIGGQLITYEFTCGFVVDSPGPDFNVYEADIGGVEFDKIDVLVSGNGIDFVSVKSSEGPVVRIPGDEAHGDDAFARSYDLSAAGLFGVRYVRIDGDGSGSAGPMTGFDLDAIGAINFVGLDCNENGIPDDCDIADGTSQDVNGNGIPDECEPPFCPATRDLSDSGLLYCPGESKTVHIDLDVPPETFAVGVEDALPPDWTDIENISHGGVYDAANHKVKWGPFFAPFPAELTYDVIPPTDAEGEYCFAGEISIDGVNEPTCGDECIEGPPYMSADETQAECGDCVDCSCATCEDHQVEMCEMIGYACAWQSGCNEDLAGMTRAAYVWQNGECYCWDGEEQNWFAITCPPHDSGCCQEGGAVAGRWSDGLVVASGEGSATAQVCSTGSDRDGKRSRRQQVRVPITIEAPEGASAMALEFEVPPEWNVRLISDGGQWDERHRKVKWGPFFTDLSRTVTFTAIQTSPARYLTVLSGTVSFDGVNRPIDVE